MGRKSAVETSNHYNEILDMIKEGLSSRSISDYLEEEYNESISHTTINSYMNKIKSKTSSEYYKKKKKKNSEIPKNVQEKKEKEEKLDEVVDKGVANKETFDEVVNDGVSDLDALDTIISLGKDLNLDVGSIKPEIHTDHVVTTPLDIVKTEIQVLRVIIQAVNAKSKKLKDDSGIDLNVNVSDKTDELNKLFDDL